MIAATLPADLGGWLHDIDPYFIRLAGPLIRWYGLSYLTGFVAGFLLLKHLARRGLIAIHPDRVLDAVVILAAGVMIGGRLGYCVFYRPSHLWTFTQSPPFWNLLAINEGGMASHGGMIGVMLACWLISRGSRDHQGQLQGRCPPMHVADAICLVGPIGIFCGRIANFINGELLGRIVAQPGRPAPWWAVRYPQELTVEPRADIVYDDIARASYLRLLNEAQLPDESDFQTLSRLVERLQAGSAEAARLLEPVLSARHPSQLYQAFAEGLVTLAAVWIVALRPRGPGVVCAWFLIVYGVGRILTEFFRLPDAHFDGAGLFDLTSPRPLGLARGQWLSALMILIGLALLLWRWRRPTTRRDLGWMRGPGAAPIDPPQSSTA